jgi:hypothetical protein
MCVYKVAGYRWYRVTKRSLCTWWLQYRKLQVMYKVSPASLQTFINTVLTLTASVIPNSNYVITISFWKDLKYLCMFLYCGHHVHAGPSGRAERRTTAARMLRSGVLIPPGAWMIVCCVCCVLSGRGLCDELITRPEESYRLCRVVCDQETSWTRRP